MRPCLCSGTLVNVHMPRLQSCSCWCYALLEHDRSCSVIFKGSNGRAVPLHRRHASAAQDIETLFAKVRELKRNGRNPHFEQRCTRCHDAQANSAPAQPKATHGHLRPSRIPMGLPGSFTWRVCAIIDHEQLDPIDNAAPCCTSLVQDLMLARYQL